MLQGFGTPLAIAGRDHEGELIEMSTDNLSSGEPALSFTWEDMVFSEPEPPPDYTPAPPSFDDTPPPQLVRTVNLLPTPEHDLPGPDDVDAIAEQILNRTREGVADIFAHDDYRGYEDEPTEAWARAIAEHQTGIPYTMPAYFYGAQNRMDPLYAQGPGGQFFHFSIVSGRSVA